MGNISIRKIEEETLQRLRARAAEHHISMEEEVRRIIRQAVLSPIKLSSPCPRLFW